MLYAFVALLVQLILYSFRPSEIRFFHNDLWGNYFGYYSIRENGLSRYADFFGDASKTISYAAVQFGEWRFLTFSYVVGHIVENPFLGVSICALVFSGFSGFLTAHICSALKLLGPIPRVVAVVAIQTLPWRLVLGAQGILLGDTSSLLAGVLILLKFFSDQDSLKTRGRSHFWRRQYKTILLCGWVASGSFYYAAFITLLILSTALVLFFRGSQSHNWFLVKISGLIVILVLFQIVVDHISGFFRQLQFGNARPLPLRDLYNLGGGLMTLFVPSPTSPFVPWRLANHFYPFFDDSSCSLPEIGSAIEKINCTQTLFFFAFPNSIVLVSWAVILLSLFIHQLEETRTVIKKSPLFLLLVISIFFWMTGGMTYFFAVAWPFMRSLWRTVLLVEILIIFLGLLIFQRLWSTQTRNVRLLMSIFLVSASILELVIPRWDSPAEFSSKLVPPMSVAFPTSSARQVDTLLKPLRSVRDDCYVAMIPSSIATWEIDGSIRPSRFAEFVAIRSQKKVILDLSDGATAEFLDLLSENPSQIDKVSMRDQKICSLLIDLTRAQLDQLANYKFLMGGNRARLYSTQDKTAILILSSGVSQR